MPKCNSGFTEQLMEANSGTSEHFFMWFLCVLGGDNCGMSHFTGSFPSVIDM